MNMYEKREQRKNKKLENNDTEKSCLSVNINWYPGHMVKAANDMRASLKLIDIVIEVLDSRIPNSSSNFMLEEMAKDKARIVVFNKVDLADTGKLNACKKEFEQKGIRTVCTNANSGENITTLIKVIEDVGKQVYVNKYKNKKIEMQPIYRAMIVGIPNVGKSTIINKISKKNTAKVGNKPGVTLKKQWIRVGNTIELLDTPGLLWPKLDNNRAGVKLALTGNIKLDILDSQELAIEGIKLLLENENYTALLKEKYKLTDEQIKLQPYDMMEAIGKNRGCVIKGGSVDLEKASNMLLDDIKNGKIGKISFE